MDIVILGLSITSSWGNGHATTYRGLVRGLAARGHRVLFLERDAPWYAGNRDEPHPRGCRTELYTSLEDLRARFERSVARADLVIVGSFVPEGARVGKWVTSIASGVAAFYDIDTPVTLAKLADGSRDYITPELILRYHLYLSFTGGPLLRRIEQTYGAPMVRALYCSVDPDLYRPRTAPCQWDLGYLGTYSADRQPALEALLLEPARCWPQGRFAVVGPMYPPDLRWPANVTREIHLSPRHHPGYYAAQRFTLNITRYAMKQSGHSPSVRLFEAGACGVPIISDWWEGLDSLFDIGKEILLSRSPAETLSHLKHCPEPKRLEIGAAARRRILAEHTPAQRALQLEAYLREVHDNFSSHSPRSHPHGGEPAQRLVTGIASEPGGETTGGETRATPGFGPDTSRLHKPAGARQ
jgi:spore maturation protein CgeB